MPWTTLNRLQYFEIFVMKIYYEFHQFAEFWNICHKKIKENICMKIDFTSLSCLKNQRNQNWICQLLRVSRAQYTHTCE